MSKLGTTTPHYSDDPVDVKGLVSKFTKVSVVKLQCKDIRIRVSIKFKEKYSGLNLKQD